MGRLKVGDQSKLTKAFSDKDIQDFARASGDHNPIHLDEEFASKTRFGQRIVHGFLVVGLISAVLGTDLPGPGTIYLGQELKFKAPVNIGDKITAVVEVIKLREDPPIATLSTHCYNQNEILVIEGQATVLIPDL